MTKLFVLLPLTLLFSACAEQQADDIPPAPDKPAAVSARGPSGKIRGVVRLRGEAPRDAFEAIGENQNVCGDKVSVSRLALGNDQGVQHAFVYLDGIQSSEKFSARESLLIDQKNCQYAPHSLIVPAGSKMEITNSDPILHNVHAHQTTGQGDTTLFNIAQPVRGQKTAVDASLTPGIVELTCEAGHPWMTGYVFVANHPYVTLSGTDGEFVIDNVPPGTYRIKMWHEGVRMKRNIKTLQKYEYEEPYETTQDVKVEANSESVVNFDLALRQGT